MSTEYDCIYTSDVCNAFNPIYVQYVQDIQDKPLFMYNIYIYIYIYIIVFRKIF